MPTPRIHLLTGTVLPGQPAFAAHVQVREDTGLDRRLVLAAFVRDWPALAAGRGLPHVGDRDRRLLALAASWATGCPVELDRSATGLDSTGVRRLLEAVLLTR